MGGTGTPHQGTPIIYTLLPVPLPPFLLPVPSHPKEDTAQSRAPAVAIIGRAKHTHSLLQSGTQCAPGASGEAGGP